MRLSVGAAVVLVIAAFVIAVLLAATSAPGGAAALPEPTPASSPTHSAAASTSSPSPDGQEVFVHVTGAVRAPGLVTLRTGSRVIDAIAAAGGLADDADPAGVNLARPLQDGEQLTVPRPGEAADAGPAQAAGSTSTAGGARVDLNRATQADLETLPRIGPALAQRILDWRAANGRFSTTADLLEVSGIGQRIFDGLADRVTV